MTIAQTKGQATPVQFGGVDDLVTALHALSEGSRLTIMHMLRDAGDEGIANRDFINPLGLTQATVSHHLRILSEAGLIVSKKKGVWVINRSNYQFIEDMLDTLREHLLPAKKRRRA